MYKTVYLILIYYLTLKGQRLRRREWDLLLNDKGVFFFQDEYSVPRKIALDDMIPKWSVGFDRSQKKRVSFFFSFFLLFYFFLFSFEGASSCMGFRPGAKGGAVKSWIIIEKHTPACVASRGLCIRLEDPHSLIPPLVMEPLLSDDSSWTGKVASTF